MPGVTIGAGAVVGASVVVSADVPADMLLMGTQKVSLSKWRVRA
jgi:acetyltransferase-like isoleucine patch superfamily enzyme